MTEVPLNAEKVDCEYRKKPDNVKQRMFEKWICFNKVLFI